MAQFDDQGRPIDSPPPYPPQTPAPPPSGTPATSFDFNRPTIVSVLYLSSFVLGISGLIGLVLAYVWKGEPHEPWEESHYTYLIRTFWLGFAGSIVSVLLMVVLIGFLLIVAVLVWVVVRCVMSLVNAQKRMPMPNPQSWLA